MAAAVDDSVLAPVLSQPSLPIALTPKQKRDPGLSEGELKVVEQRAANDGLCALGPAVQRGSVGARRSASRRSRTGSGDAFEVIEINSKKGNEHGFGKMAHSVLTLEVREQDGHPAYEARKRVVEFLTELSRSSSSPGALRPVPAQCLPARLAPRRGNHLEAALLWLSSSSSGVAIGTPLYTAR